MTQTNTTQQEAPPVEQEQPVQAAPAPAEASDFHKEFIEDKEVTWRAPTVEETAHALPAILEQAEIYFRAGVCGKAATLAQANAKALGAHSLGKTMMWGFENLVVSKDGRLGMMATGMRGLFFERVPGARIEYLETTPEICRMRAYRPGKGWTMAQWTQEDSERAGLVAAGRSREGGDYTTSHGKYPEDMKVARCTSRLARRCWPDILGGCTYLPEELGQETAPPSDAPPVAPDAPQAPPRRERQPDPPALTFAALWSRWCALAQARKDAGDEKWAVYNTPENPKLPGAWFRSYVSSVLGRDAPMPTNYTPEELAEIMADMEAHGDPRTLAERETAK